jgi:ubiquinone/menaquinone biosynthesis C-methylase UbiE
MRALMDAVMDYRSRKIIGQIGDWLPATGPLLDLGSGTGHLAAYIERERGVDVVTADVADLHKVGRRPVVITEGRLPFDDDSFAATLLLYMLAYPRDPAAVLTEAARVTRPGAPVIVVQTLSANAFGRAWHRGREFTWTFVAFHVARMIGYVAREARFTMSTRRFYSIAGFEREIERSGLRVRASRARAVLPGGALVVAAFCLERGD